MSQLFACINLANISHKFMIFIFSVEANQKLQDIKGNFKIMKKIHGDRKIHTYSDCFENGYIVESPLYTQ